MMGFGSVGVGNGGSSSPFSNLSPLAPPFTLDRSNFKPISSTLVEMTEPSFEVPLNSSLHNWLPPSSQASGLDYFSNPGSEFDWSPFSSGSRYPGSLVIEPSDNHVPLLGRFSMSSTDTSLYGDSSDGLTTSIGKAKPYYPSYVSTSRNKGCPTVTVDQPSYDWLSNPHVAKFDEPSCKNYSQVSSGTERSLEQASHSIDMLGLDKCSEFVREQPNEVLLLEQSLNMVPGENLGISNMDAYSAFPGCHPKTKTPPFNLGTSSQISQFLEDAPYHEILGEQYARLSDTTTSIVNSPATFSIRPPVVSTNSFVWNMGPCKNSDYGYDLAEANQGGNNLSNLKDFLPFSSESRIHFDTENHGVCINKNDPVISKSSSTKTPDLPNSICAAEDSSDHMLKAEVGLPIPDASPHFCLDLKTIKTAAAVESSSESFDQYNLAVDSPCWKGAPVSRISPFEASEIVTPHQVKKIETCNSVNFSLPQIPCGPAEDNAKASVHAPNESTVDSSLDKVAASSPKMPSVASDLPAEQQRSDSVKARDYNSKMGCFHPVSNNIHEPVEGDVDSKASHSMPQDHYQHNLMSGKRIASTSFMEKHADARLNSGNSAVDGLSHLLCGATKHVQHLPSCTEDRPFKLEKAYHGESISKIDIQILVDAVQNLSELLLAYCSNGMGALHQKYVKSLRNVMSNLDRCIINSVGPQDFLSPKQRTSQNLGQIHLLHRDVGVPKSQMANVECPLYDWDGFEKKNQHILSVKEDKRAADSLYTANGIDFMKEDYMTQALKKVLSENFHDEEEHPQTVLYKNLWLEAEAALCAFNFRARFNRAKLEMEKHGSPKVRESAENQDEQPVSDVSPGPSTSGKFTSETEVSPTTFISVQTSPAVSISRSSHMDDVITRFHILKCRNDETKHSSTKNSGKLSGFKVSVEEDMVEKSALDKKQTPVLDIKGMDSSCPTSKVMKNDCGTALAPTSPILTTSSHMDDVMSRFQILKTRDEHMNSVNAVKVQKMSSTNCSKVVTLAPKGDAIISPGISMKNPTHADNKYEVDNSDASVNVLMSYGNNIRLTPAGEQLQEVVYQYSGSERDYWPVVENKVTRGGLDVEMEPFLRHEPDVSTKDNLTRKESTTHVEDKLPAGCFDGSSSDWEHVLWGE